MTKKEEREYLFNKTNSRCGYCGDILPKRWHIDHIEPVYRIWYRKDRGKFGKPENDKLDNKIASCPSCNLYKSVFNLEEFRREIQENTRKLLRHTGYKMALKYGIIKETEVKVKFYFETNPPEGK